MKRKVYILTFLTYASVHMMRMTYSFNKYQFQQKFAIRSFFLGLLDTIMFLTLAIGTLFRYSILKDNRLILMCLKNSIPTALSFCIIPFLSLLKGQTNDKQSSLINQIIMIISIGSFGFFQFIFFPALITIFSYSYNVKESGKSVGIWSSKSNFGNILGFFLASLLVHQFKQKWETTMFLSAIILLIVSLLFYFLVQEVQDSNLNITSDQFFSYLKQKWGERDFKLYILSFSCFKTILYSYQLWTPVFISTEGFPQFSGYVPMAFDIATLFGSLLMGKLYEQNQDQQIKSTHRRSKSLIKTYKFTLSSIFIVIISFLYVFFPSKLLIYFMLAIFMGLFLGGVYNALQNSQILKYSKNNPKITDMLSTINIGIGSAIVALLQLIIGILMNFTEKKQLHKNEQINNTKTIYIVIGVLGIVAMIFSFLRAYLYNRNKISSNEILNEQNRNQKDDNYQLFPDQEQN